MITIKKFLFSIWTYRLLRILIVCIFMISGLTKLIDPNKFANIIAEYALLPEILINPVAIMLPAFEIIIAIALLIDIRFSLSITTGLLIIFIAILWFGILKNLDIDCGCFSIGETKEHSSLRNALYRDFIFLFICIFLYLWRHINNLNYSTKPIFFWKQK